MTVLVTGATGFLGSHLAMQLAERGDDVRVLVRRTSDRRRLEGLTVTYVEGDIVDKASVERAVDGVTHVYHCAALYELGTADEALMERINVGGTENVLDAAAAQGATTVHVSSVAAMGPTGPDPVDESHWRSDAPASAYERTKRAAHELARERAKAGASVRITMPGMIYGPDDPSLVGTANRFLAAGLPFGILATTKLAMVHVDDCADGLIRVAEKGTDGGEYILGGTIATFREWFDTIAPAAGRRKPLVWLPDGLVYGSAPIVAAISPIGSLRRLIREGMGMAGRQNWAYSSDKARRELGWEPRSLEEGMTEVGRWYAERRKQR